MRAQYESKRNRFKYGFEIPMGAHRGVYLEIVEHAIKCLSGKTMNVHVVEKAFHGLVSGSNGFYNKLIFNNTVLDKYLAIDGVTDISILEAREINRALKDLVVNYDEKDELYSMGLKMVKDSISRPKIPVFHNDVRNLIKDLEKSYNTDKEIYERLQSDLRRFAKSPAYKVGDKILKIMNEMFKHIPCSNGEDEIDVCGRKFRVTKKELYAMAI